MGATSWFSKILGPEMTLDNLESVLILQLQDLRSAEEQLIDALPKMAAAVRDAGLRDALTAHLEETRVHASRLEQVFRILDRQPIEETCEAMRGLIAEGSELMEMTGDPSVKDAALIAAAQRIEHYEMAGYGSARTFALALGLNEIADILQQTLDEEGSADRTLTKIAETSVNSMALAARPTPLSNCSNVITNI